MNKIAEVATEVAKVLEKHGVKGFVFLYDSEQGHAGVTEALGEDSEVDLATHMADVFRDVAVATKKFTEAAKEGVPVRTTLASVFATGVLMEGLKDENSAINRTLNGEHLGPEAEIITVDKP